MEPYTAPYKDRIAALRKLHDLDCKTWVSIEQYPTPNLIDQSLEDILSELSFVDKIIFGRTNYSKDATAYKKHREFYNKQAEKVIEFCNDHKIKFHIKEIQLLIKICEVTKC